LPTLSAAEDALDLVEMPDGSTSVRRNPVRVLVYSPTRLFGEGIAAFVGSIETVSAVQVEHDVVDLAAKMIAFDANLAIFDVTTPDAMPLARIAALGSDVATIALAVSEVAEQVIACADAGFAAYVPRTATIVELVSIIDQVIDGGTVCDPRIARSLFNELARRRPPSEKRGCDEPLTRREIETARLVGRGLSNKEIAHELNLSVATIKNHVHSVLLKLHVSRRTQVGTLLADSPWVLRLP
jgi:DNA-binding NarL/FixJ family response regulator